jgi:hypothetical protein
LGVHAIGQVVPAEVVIEDGRNTYLLANFPNERLAGQLLVSNSTGSSP